MKKLILLILLFGFRTQICLSAELPARARVTFSVSEPKLAEVNNELTTNNIKNFSAFPQLGAEVTFGVSPMFDLGLNYLRKSQQVNSSVSTNSTSFAKIDQNVLMAIARVNFIRGTWFRWDVFGAAGGSSTTMTYQTLSQSGEYSKKDTLGSFAARYGSSVAFGFKGIYLCLEAGYELNKMTNPKMTGTLDGTIKTIDMSGPYGSVGVIFDSPELSKK